MSRSIETNAQSTTVPYRKLRNEGKEADRKEWNHDNPIT